MFIKYSIYIYGPYRTFNGLNIFYLAIAVNNNVKLATADGWREFIVEKTKYNTIPGHAITLISSCLNNCKFNLQLF